MSGDHLQVDEELVIPAAELSTSTSRSGGPGGQHANKTETRVTLRWAVADSAVVSGKRKARLLDRLENRLTDDGELLVHAASSRSQSQNRKEARERLADIVRDALKVERRRKPTRPSRSSRRRRIEAKRRRGEKKASRSWRWKG